MQESLPKAFVDKMTHLLGSEAKAFWRSYEAPAVHGLRINTMKIAPEAFMKFAPFPLRPVPWAQDGFYVDPTFRPGKHPFHEIGMYYLQEPSAMAPAYLLSVLPGHRVLDLCAAPGGKSGQLAAALKGSGLLISNEIHPARVNALGTNLERLGVSNAVILQEDPVRLAERFPCFFDRILVDAPCSGEGMFRKNPEVCRQWTPEASEHCRLRQLSILRDAAKMLKAGGLMVYSTCTFSPEENEGVLAAFLTEHPAFSLEQPALQYPLSHGIPAHGDGRAEMSRALRFWPHRHPGEGHFMALLLKQGKAEDASAMGGGTALSPVEPEARALTDFWEEALRLPTRGTVHSQNGHCFLLPEEALPVKGLKVLRPGLYLGQEAKDRFIPSHSLAMALKPHQAVRCIEVSESEGTLQRYLAGETLPAGGRGWALVCCAGVSAGWGKVSGGVMKNHYPKGLRLRY